MKFFEWSENFSVNIPEIDDQHKIIVDLLNELYNAFMNKEHDKKLGEIIKKLSEYANFHFNTEEKYFSKFPDESITNHLEQHEDFKKKIESYKNLYSKDISSLTFIIMQFIKGWLINHISGTDKAYFLKIKNKLN